MTIDNAQLRSLVKEYSHHQAPGLAADCRAMLVTYGLAAVVDLMPRTAWWQAASHEDRLHLIATVISVADQMAGEN